MTHRQRIAVLATLTLAACLVRYAVSTRQGLDIDEVFSLAIATGHSIEQPAASSRPDLGDFVQAPTPQNVSYYRRYAAHDASPAGMSRVVRAVFLSDTNPPLYYLALNLWTRITGTSDGALRAFSILLSVMCVPLGYLLARRLYDPEIGLLSAALIAFAPQAVFYGSLGRMYPMLVVLTLAAAIVAESLHRNGFRRWTAACWIFLSAAGLLTHYFFAFAWLAMGVWLLIYPGKIKRAAVAALSATALLLVTPWYLRVPESLSGWRVTKGWLETRPAGFNPLTAQVRALAGYFRTSGDWMNRNGIIDYIIVALLLLVVTIACMRRVRSISRATQLLVAWVVFSNLGLLVFDLLQGTYARSLSRYAFAGQAAALILFAVMLARLPRTARYASLAALLSLWAIGLTGLSAIPSADNPFRSVAQTINAKPANAGPVVVHSIPSGVIGMSRYLDDNAKMMDWVKAFGTRTLDDADHLARTSPGLTLVKWPTSRVVAEETRFRMAGQLTDSSGGRGYTLLTFRFANSR